ncbi:MAG: phosphotransferase [Lachnospiraceae bacterium]|nr:phosphotransferase [Lachnospiraceae bacterium]
MSERGTGVLDQYDLEVSRTWRTRGAFLCETSQGLKLLKEWTGSDKRIQLEYEVLSALTEVGLQVDCCIQNAEGNLISPDEDQARYVLRDWYEGRECNTRETGEILAAAELLAKLHMAFRRLEKEHIPEQKREEFLRKRKEREEQKAMEEIQVAETKLSERETAKESDSLSWGETASAGPEREEGTICQELPEDFAGMLERHNRELKRTRSFVKARKRKTDFELVVIGGFEKFYRQAEEAAALAADLPEMPKNWWCHGEYSHHHVLLGDGVCAVTDFSRLRKGIQVSDLYYFTRKVLEKHRWNLKLGRRLLDTYATVLPLTGEEWKYLYILFLYPEKYWKQINYYVNSNKAWIPARNVDKLRVLETQFEARALFLEELKKKAEA